MVGADAHAPTKTAAAANIPIRRILAQKSRMQKSPWQFDQAPR
jgi:hypothetical protein